MTMPSDNKKLWKILDKLLGEWGASPAFESEQIERAIKKIEALIADQCRIAEKRGQKKEIELLGDELDKDHSNYHYPGEDGEVYDMNRWYEDRIKSLEEQR